MKLGLTEKQYKNLLSLLQEQAEPPPAEPEKGTSDKQAGGQGYPQVGKWESGVTRGAGNQVGVTKWADVVGAKLTRGKANPLKENHSRYINEQDAKTSNEEMVKLVRGVKQPTPPISLKEYNPNMCKYYEYGRCPADIKNIEGDFYFWHYESILPTNTWAYTDDLHAGEYKLGNYGTNDFVGKKSDMDFYYESELNWWLIANMNTTLDEWKRYHNRISKSGKTVPKGFDPDKYDEYLSKQSEIQKQIDDIEKRHSSNWNPFKPNFGPGGYWNEKDLQKYNGLKQRLIDLKNEYSNNEFSYGITQEELNQYNTKKKEINDYYSQKVKESENPTTDVTSVTMNTKAGTINPTTTVDNPIVTEWESKLMELDMLFGKDDWAKDTSILGQTFDRFWDKWGTLVQIVGNVAMIAASGGIAGVVEGAVGAVGFTVAGGVLRASAPYVADATFNALIGTYEASRHKNEEALISFLCAMVPYVSYTRNIGKVSMETATNLSKKLILTKFDTPDSLQMLIKSLSPEERLVFRDVMSLPKEAIKNDLDLAVRFVNKSFKEAGLIVDKAGLLTWGPKVISQLGIEGGVPVTALLVNSFFNIIKDSYGHIYSKEELIQVKQYLSTLIKMNRYEFLVKAAKSLDNIQNVNKNELVSHLSKTMNNKETPYELVKDLDDVDTIRKRINQIRNNK